MTPPTRRERLLTTAHGLLALLAIAGVILLACSPGLIPVVRP